MKGLRYLVILTSLSSLVAFLCSIAVPVWADVELADVYGDYVVLQRGMVVPVWGQAVPGEEVTVEFAGQKKTTTANDAGDWMIELDALAVGGPHKMTIKGDSTFVLENILVGEVWICSGQSNMQWPVRAAMNASEEIEAAQYPEIRFFTVTRKVSDELEENLEGEWQVCGPQSVGEFSAVGYFFGRTLHRDLGVPIGLIHSSWGGTPAEAWTPRPVLEAHADFHPILERYKEAFAKYPEASKDYEDRLAQWEAQREEGTLQDRHVDPGNVGFAKGWAELDHDVSEWKEMELPQLWEKTMDIDGAVWFRREVSIPEAWSGKDLDLSLGAIDDFDVTYFNGIKVGEMDEKTAGWWTHPRHYTVPGELVKAGRAVIAVRIFDHFAGGGFRGVSTDMKLMPQGEEESISLAGSWNYQVEVALDPGKLAPNRRPTAPFGPGHPHSPSGLYNAMIHPLIPYAIRGAIWYQGESNAGRAYQYRTLFPAMIRAWRDRWNQGNFPFLFVQLANFMPIQPDPAESAWAELREAQLMALSLPNTGMATIIDIGEARDIHPKNKQDVGKRLAWWALVKSYGKDLVYSGPLYESMQIEENRVRLTFQHVGGGLIAKGGGPLKGFAMAGEDSQFVWADAVIEGNTVVVSSKAVDAPVAVRYAWADNPECNLYNKEGLPASPFRTDQWKGVTMDKR